MKIEVVTILVFGIKIELQVSSLLIRGVLEFLGGLAI